MSISRLVCTCMIVISSSLILFGITLFVKRSFFVFKITKFASK